MRYHLCSLSLLYQHAVVSVLFELVAEELQATRIIVAERIVIIFFMCIIYFLISKTYFTICSASASESAGCGVIGTVPQFPEPPLITLSASIFTFASVFSYLFATSRYAGPVTFSSTLWQVRQSFEAIMPSPFDNQDLQLYHLLQEQQQLCYHYYCCYLHCCCRLQSAQVIEW